MPPLLHSAVTVFMGLAIAALLARIAYAITDRVAQAPRRDLFVSLFTWAGTRPDPAIHLQSLLSGHKSQKTTHERD